MIQLPILYERMKALEIFEKIDLHFGVFLSSHAPKYKPEVFLTGIFLSRYTREGHTCVPLTLINRGIRKLTEPASHRDLEETALPSEITIEHLTESGIAYKETGCTTTGCTTTGCTPTGCTPVVICHGHLYLQKYWHYEKSIAGVIERMTEKMDRPVNPAILRDSLKRLFPAGNGSEGPDWQKTASIAALYRRFFVLTGGPGTGKTTTVAKILALLLEQNSNLSIAVAAPTGKAAGRIEESLKREKEKLDISDALKERIPSTASTIHRLLKPVIYSPHFRHNRISPLTADVVVVDEASMVDLPLMAKLLDSLREGGRLILAGDKNQLASVETGSVFGDVCAEGNIDTLSEDFAEELQEYIDCPITTRQKRSSEWLSDSVIELKKNYRFGDESLIGKLSREIVQSSLDGVIELLSACREPTGREPSGREPTGREPTGREPSGREPTGREPSGREPTGREPSGREPSGREPSGREPTGREPSGREPSGREPSGREPSGREPSGRDTSGRDTSGREESDRDASYSTTSDCHQSGLELVWRELPERQHFRDEFIKRVRKDFLEYAKSTDVSSAFRKLMSFRVLSPLRKGWCGVEALNRIAEEIMAERNPSILTRRIYPLKPLLITSNDYNLKLYNGDLGIVFPDEHKKLRAYFESDTGASDPHRSFFTGRLPEYEPAFAMTVHKSQGSEFEDVLLILPPEESPVLTRELLYTAVTRARKRVEIWGSEEIIRKAARNKTERISGIEKHLKAYR